ncbi:HTH_Tnp_Tc3_2 domain-containing protein [Trichonephila clavipes]|nr:HTH_Tnp_Tc3_2 domain-containing protein [Trichonephila clavipes]
MKNWAGWTTRRVAGQVDRSECTVRNCVEQWTREGTHARENWVWSDQEDHEEKIEESCGKHLWTHSDSFNDTSRRRRVAIVPQTISRHLAEANLKSKHPFRALPFNTGTYQQLRLQWCQARSM